MNVLFKKIIRLPKLKFVVFCASAIFCIGLLGYLLLVLVYCIPTESNIKNNVTESCIHFSKEEHIHSYMDKSNSYLDMVEDAMMLCVAVNDLSGNPFMDAAKASYNSPSNGIMPQIDIVYLYDRKNFDVSNYPFSEDSEYIYGRY